MGVAGVGMRRLAHPSCFVLLIPPRLCDQGTTMLSDAKGDWDSVSGTDSETLILRRLRSNSWRSKEPGALSNKAFTCVISNAHGRAISQPVTVSVSGAWCRAWPGGDPGLPKTVSCSLAPLQTARKPGRTTANGAQTGPSFLIRLFNAPPPSFPLRIAARDQGAP